MHHLKALIVDDEALARSRLRTLLGDCKEPSVWVGAQAACAAEAVQALQREFFDVVLLDIAMPGADGLTLAKTLSQMPRPPAVVFVTAHSEHALQAFELEAADYLTKPVRLERLQQALRKVERSNKNLQGLRSDLSTEFLLTQDRGQTERIALDDVLYLRAEFKYITVRTAKRHFVLDGSLSELERQHSAHLLRIHRNTLVSRRAMRALVKHIDEQEGEVWALRLQGIDEVLMVSRRQLSAVREALAA